MKNSESAKTLTASLSHDAQTLFAWIAEPENLPRWHTAFCRGLRKENGTLVVDSPRGSVPARWIRSDHALVLDILVEVSAGIELTHAIRVLSTENGSEMVWTLVKAEGISESVFNEQMRWAGTALQALRKVSLEPAPASEAILLPAAISEDSVTSEAPIPGPSTEPMQAPSPAEVSSMPQSGKKLFIGNLSYDWTDTELRAHFSGEGTVTTAEVARFRGRGGRSRGFGFVEMGSEAEAQSAIEKLHGGVAGGRQIIVRLAKSQESRPVSNGSGSPDQPTSAAPERGASPASSRRRPMPRSARPERPRRTAARRPPSSGPRPYVETDITNKSGYEIFPRGARGDSSASTPPADAPRRSNIEASPYMEDTGDIENRGNRAPRHRRRH